MAKGQVTEKDLQTGLRAAGGFAGLTQSKARRDSPFSVERPAVTEVANEPVPKPVDEPKKLEVKEIEPERKEQKISKEAKPTAQPKPQKSVARKLDKQTKADLFSERITLNISAESRDRAEAIARTYQRNKADKSERITANTVYRAAIRVVLHELDALDDLRPNTEDELFELLKERLKV